MRVDWVDRNGGVDSSGGGRFASEIARPSASDRCSGHWILEDGGSAPFRLADIDVPTLVMHGTTDPLFPFGHGEALAAEIPGATLIPLEGMGHEIPPPPLSNVVVPAIVKHTATTAPRPEPPA